MRHAFSTGTGSDSPSRAVEVLLVCSAGGHLLQLYLLRAAWQDIPHAWVSLEREDALSLLSTEETVFYGYGPTTRSALNLTRNLRVALTLLWKLRPHVIITTGAGIAVPFAWIGRLTGARIVYVESLTRIDKPSLTCRLIRPIADRVYVQWPELAANLPESRYAGTVLGRP